MNPTALHRFRSRVHSDEAALGLWITLETPSITEMAVGAEMDWVVIDAEHGHLDWGDITEHLRCLVRSHTVGLVRIAELNGSLIKRALDCGADGVIVPWIETTDQLREAVSWARYPPAGRRGIGAERATAWGQSFREHVAESAGILVIPIIESVRAAENIETLLDVPGPEVFFFGPADFSSSAGFPGEWEGPGIAGQILDAAAAIRKREKCCGVMARDETDLRLRKDQGFTMIGVASDSGLILRGMRSSLQNARRVFAILHDLCPSRPGAEPQTESPFTSGNGRATSRLEGSETVSIAPGVTFERLGEPNGPLPSFTIGWATLEPGALLPGHFHTFAEALLLASGMAEAQVADRLYTLALFDQLSIPASIPHSVRNASQTESARILVAMAAGVPSRELVGLPPIRATMRPDDHGFTGPEWIVRSALLQRSSPRKGVILHHASPGRHSPGTLLWDFLCHLEPGAEFPLSSAPVRTIAVLQGNAAAPSKSQRIDLNTGDALAVAVDDQGELRNTGDSPAWYAFLLA